MDPTSKQAVESAKCFLLVSPFVSLFSLLTFNPRARHPSLSRLSLGFVHTEGRNLRNEFRRRGRKVILMTGFSTDGYVIQRGCCLTSPSLRLLISGMRKPVLRTHCRTEPIYTPVFLLFRPQLLWLSRGWELCIFEPQCHTGGNPGRQVTTRPMWVFVPWAEEISWM